ncbi:ESX secretion-associated protein EspG [Nocardia sp. AG03]|uniref:ESX secretion-associated protein EspG n=1 Tax=Nocardia sp. AG03 TaxID=3025312 RepID=UPI00241890EE|nr:ESX secretion-associated protein EspG [Nocardia sp. AG03]
MASWTFEPETFAAHWYSDANDRFPVPLKYLSRFGVEDEFSQFRSRVRADLRSGEREEIDLAVHTLATSRIRIEIVGCTTRHKSSTGADDSKEYRIVGVRDHHRAVLAFQGGRAGEYGDIRLRLFGPDGLAGQLAGAIPRCEPGGRPPATFHPHDLEPGEDGYFEDSHRDSERERYERLLGRSGDGYGIARLYIGRPRSSAEHSGVLRWFDVTGDGRYAETRGQHVTVRPGSRDELAARFARWVDRAGLRLAEQQSQW